MYDRQEKEENKSLWSQATGEAVVGVKTGEKLKYVESEIRSFGSLKKEFSTLKVLSKDTGNLRIYGSDPYEGYYDDNVLFFPTNFKILDIHPKEKVITFRNDNINFFLIKKNITEIEQKFDLKNDNKILIKRDGEKIRTFLNGNKIITVEAFAFS
jgi:hypothetical protein